MWNKQYNNTANKANTANGLPYTGSNSSIVFIFIAFVASAIYAYKKVNDYKKTGADLFSSLADLNNLKIQCENYTCKNMILGLL